VVLAHEHCNEVWRLVACEGMLQIPVSYRDWAIGWPRRLRIS